MTVSVLRTNFQFHNIEWIAFIDYDSYGYITLQWAEGWRPLFPCHGVFCFFLVYFLLSQFWHHKGMWSKEDLPSPSFLMRLIHNCSRLIFSFIKEFSLSCSAFDFSLGCEPPLLCSFMEWVVTPINRPALPLYFLKVRKAMLLVTSFTLTTIPYILCIFPLSFYSSDITIWIYLFLFKNNISSNWQINYPFAFASCIKFLSWIHDRISGKCGCKSVVMTMQHTCCSVHMALPCLPLFLGSLFLLLNWR